MKSNSRYLITTSNHLTWKYDRPVLFLGEWCKKYDENLNNLNYEIVKPYGIGYKNRDKDISKAREIEKKIIPKLSNILNNTHNLNFSERYWKILFHPWLRRYVETMINRINNIIFCFDNYNVSGSTFFNDDYNFTPKDSYEAILKYDDDVWNNILYKKIIEKLNILNFDKNIIDYKYQSTFKKKFSLKKFLFFLLLDLFNFFTKLFNKNSGVYFDPYLSLKDKINLYFHLRQLPYLWNSTRDLNFKQKYNNELRVSLRKKIIQVKYTDKIEEIIFDMIFELIPMSFIESYQYINNISNKLSLPNKPKFIATSNAFDFDELFKFWASFKIEKQNVKYIILQHGNNYGTHRYINPSVEELNADKFITWGWTVSNNNKYIKGFLNKTKNLNLKKKSNPSKFVLITEDIHHRYWTYDSHFEYAQKYQSIKKFIENFPVTIKNNLLLRMHIGDKRSNYNMHDRLIKSFPNLNIEFSKNNYLSTISNSKIVIFNYDCTGILELLALNFPFIAFLHNKTDHLRDSAKPFYNLLEKEGIIHYNVESAIFKINEIYENIDKWWESDNVQKARDTFCKKFARTSKNPGYDISKIINKIS